MEHLDVFIASVGCLCLGLTMGWLVRYFIERFKEYNAQILGSTVSVFLGGCIVGFLKLLAPPKASLVLPGAFYLIGLPIGLTLFYPMILHLDAQFKRMIQADEVLARKSTELRLLSREIRLKKKLAEFTESVIPTSPPPANPADPVSPSPTAHSVAQLS